MEGVLEKAAVKRCLAALEEFGIHSKVKVLSDTARSAQDAATGLGIEVGQIASSIVFKLPDESPLLVITSGRHRVDTELVCKHLGIESLGRADADYIKERTGYSIGGVSPVGWTTPATVLIDLALDDYDVVWAAAGHPHAVFPTSFAELSACTRATPVFVGD